MSDFYAAYNAVRCFQQKCLIHLIRDMNDEVLKHSYDDELKRLVGAFAGPTYPAPRRKQCSAIAVARLADLIVQRHQLSCSSSALASLRSAVVEASVNQL